MSSFKFKKKKIDKTRKYILPEMNHNHLMSENYKKKCKNLNYVEHLLILISKLLVGFVLIAAFASLVFVPGSITSSEVRIKNCKILAGIKKYNSIIKKKKKKRGKKVLLGKDTLNIIKVLISKALIDSYISHEELFPLNNVLREYNEMKEEIKLLELLQNTLHNSNGNLLCQL